MNTETRSPGKLEVLQPTHYVGIGASAGGLEALESFFRNMPNDTGVAFIIVQHLSPDYKSMMVELLSRKTNMKVIQIEDGMEVEANCVYLVPPKKNLEIYHSRLILVDQVRETGLNLPIDIFFRSLALDKRKHAIGVVLSGTGSDGSLGIRSIKELGGMVMVQDFKDAKFDGMPKSAIATGLVDYVLDAEIMGDALVKYIRHPLVAQTKEEKELSKEETDFVKILSIIRTNVGEDFSYYKPKTIIRRIERRISVNQINNTGEYIELLLHSKKECEILAKEFLIGVTQFFRDKAAFESLYENIIPALFEERKDKDEIRIWIVASSTGEEAYSIAILCKEYMAKNKIRKNVKIFATDLDKEAIKYAGTAVYTESIVADLDGVLLAKYFIQHNGAYQINDEIRQMVVFSSHNVITDPPFSKIDLISCRNLLIYLKNDIQEKILGLFQYSLGNGGFLFLGSSESLSGMSNAFDVIDSKNKLFKYKKGFKPPHLSGLLDVRTAPRKYLNTGFTFESDRTIPVTQSLQQILYEKVVNYFAPSGVIVDKNNIIIHFFRDIQRFLTYPEGKPSFNLVDIANEQLSMVLSNMLFKVRKENKEVVLKKVKFKENSIIAYLTLSAKPISVSKDNTDYVVVTFTVEGEQEQSNDTETNGKFDINEQASERIRELEQELQYRDENLQTTIEELETSNEELQATNEELVSSNEELQSTNEELQSVNEELYTVNSQYQEKINELTTLNNDMNNLLSNTNIGTLFLDSKLTVRKYTQEISKIVNVMDVDIGRPFNHLTLKCNYDEIYRHVNETLETLKIRETEIQTDDGRWYLIRIQPYRHDDKSIHGVLITQVDITALQKSKARFKHLFDTMTHGVVYQGRDGKINSVNPAAERILGLTHDQMIGLTSRDPKWRAIKENGSEFPGEEHPAMVALRTGEPVNNVIMGVFNPQINSTTWIRVNATPLFTDGEKEPVEVYATFEDITGQIDAENHLKETLQKLETSRTKYSMLFNSMKYGFAYHKIIVDRLGKPIDYEFVKVNDAFEKITGIKRTDVVGKTVKTIMPETEDYWIETYGKVALDGETHDFKHFSKSLDKNFKVNAYSPEKGYFVTIFEEIE